MKLAMIGTGYVGLVAGAGFADFGNDVACVDVDDDRIARLKNGEIPIYEPHLGELVERNVRSGRLTFTTEIAHAVAGAAAVFIAVGTPQSEISGSADLSYVLAAAEQIGRALTGFAAIVTKSTVPVGTADRIREIVARVARHPFSVASNPEFLKEGDAVNDFMKPARIVIGVEDDRARHVLETLYAPFVRTNDRIHVMDVRSAELTKYAANAMLATRISFMNEMALLAERVQADIDSVRRAIGADPRIGPRFLFPGPGFGGSCLVGRETVLIRRHGRVELVRLDNLIGDPAEPTPLLETRDDLEVLALEACNVRSRFFPVRCLTRRPYEGEICEVKTKMGRRVRCTPDHPFVVTDANGRSRRTVRADELTTEDWLPLAGPTHGAKSEEQVFDLLDTLPVLDIAANAVLVRVGKQRVCERDVTESIRQVVAEPSRLHDIRRTGTLRLHEALEAKLDLTAAMLGTCRSGTYVPSRIIASPEFWRIVGLYGAEGWISTDTGRAGAERLRISWAFHPSAEQDLVDEVVGYFRSLGVEAKVHAAPTTMKVSVSSRLLARFFARVLRVGSDCYEKRIPDAIWDASPECKLALLSGLWRSDGSFSFVRNKRGIVCEYGTVSRALADGMLRLLGEVGIVAGWRVGRPAKSTVDTHFLRISGADQVERLLCFVPDRHHATITASITGQSKRIAPTGWRSDDSMRVRVTSLERRPFRGHVYSLEVPGAGTFVTTGGLVVHNCFPKDLRALLHTAEEAGTELGVVRAVEHVNERQKHVLGARVIEHFGGKLDGRRIAVWGLAFKPETDDVRESPALVLIEELLSAGARVAAHDPEALETARARLGDRIEYASDPYEAAVDADALVLVTEWHSFRLPDFPRLKSLLKTPVLFDGRNAWTPSEVRELGFTYYGIGRR